MPEGYPHGECAPNGRILNGGTFTDANDATPPYGVRGAQVLVSCGETSDVWVGRAAVGRAAMGQEWRIRDHPEQMLLGDAWGGAGRVDPDPEFTYFSVSPLVACIVPSAVANVFATPIKGARPIRGTRRVFVGATLTGPLARQLLGLVIGGHA